MIYLSLMTSEAANPKAESNVNNNMCTLGGRVWRSRDGLGIARLTARRRSAHTSTFPLNADVAVGPGSFSCDR